MTAALRDECSEPPDAREAPRLIHVLEHELHRRVLTLTILAACPLPAGVEHDVGIASGIDEGARPHRERSALARDDDGFQLPAVDDNIAYQRVEIERDARFTRHQTVEQPLGGPGHIEEDG